MTRIYLWDYPSWAACPPEYVRHTLTFVDDLSTGGTLEICGYCGEEIEVRRGVNCCPKCKENLIFGRTDV